MAAFYPRCDVVLEILLEDFADGDGETVLDIVTVPRSATWIRDHQRSADTFELELDYRDLPIDPRLARAIRVSILCADVGAPDARLDPDNDNHRAFLGFVDQPETLLDDSGERVRLEGRDYTALFLDTTWSGEHTRHQPPGLEELINADPPHRRPGTAGMSHRLLSRRTLQNLVLSERVRQDGVDAPAQR